MSYLLILLDLWKNTRMYRIDKAKSSLVIDCAKRRLREAIIPFKENEAEIASSSS
jgi:hypothetical protein